MHRVLSDGLSVKFGVPNTILRQFTRACRSEVERGVFASGSAVEPGRNHVSESVGGGEALADGTE